MIDAVAHGFGTDVAGPASFVVELTEFSGPLDLLLTLIREEQVDIYDIPIARIAEQFLVRIRTLQLNEAADYLEMAARLLRIKAQLLLPRSEGEEGWDDPRAELVRRLLEYQQMREVVDVLERAGEERRNRFARAYLPQAATPPESPLALSLSGARRDTAFGGRAGRDQRDSRAPRAARARDVDRPRTARRGTLARLVHPARAAGDGKAWRMSRTATQTVRQRGDHS